MIDPLVDAASREASLRQMYARLRFFESVAVTGINDVGKTTLLSLAQRPEVIAEYAPAELATRTLFVHVDCNLLAGSSESDLYAVLWNSTLQAASRAGYGELSGTPWAAPVKPDSAVVAAAALQGALIELIEQKEVSLVFLFDEFDALYRRLPASAFLSLRAFDNRLGPALAYVVATEQPLRRMRPDEDAAEFEELFTGGTFTLLPLEQPAAEAVVRRYVESREIDAPKWLPGLIATLSGGHPGLIRACCAAAPGLDLTARAEAEVSLSASPAVVAECEHVWERLSEEARPSIAGEIPLLTRYAERFGGAVGSGLVVSDKTGEVTVDGRPPATPLGPTEFRLLSLLAARPGALVTKDEIARTVWPQETRIAGVDDARIDKLVDRVRSKIEPDARSPRYLVTVRGLGYRLHPNGA
jgi:hypothetical protein